MSYYLVKKLPSCLVEPQLLLELEGYAQRKAKELVPPESKFYNLKYEFVIQDSMGIERLGGVGDFQRAYFPDDTSRLEINLLASAENRSFFVEIEFTLYKGGSEVTVRFDGNSAREVTTGIVNEIISIAESYRTSNFLFHGFWIALIGGLVTSVILSILQVFGPMKPSDMSLPKGLIIVAVVAICVAAFVEIYKPYTTFRTRRNEKRGKQVSWVMLGVLGFILFTVIGVYFRQKLVGF